MVIKRIVLVHICVSLIYRELCREIHYQESKCIFCQLAGV